MLWTRTVGKGTHKCLGFGQDFGHHALGFFEDFSNMFSSIGVFHIDREKMKSNLAATFSTRITFGTAIDTHASTARGLMQLVHSLARVIEQVEFGDTTETLGMG